MVYSTGISSINQIFQGGRRPGVVKPYIDGFVKQKANLFLHGDGITVDETNYNTDTNPARAHIISLEGGLIDFDGRVFTLDTQEHGSHINLDLIAPHLCAKTGEAPEYILAAVPSYDEPMSVSEAQAAGLNWYLTQECNGEFVTNYFLDPECESIVACSGGFTSLKRRVMDGCATCEEIKAYNKCAEAREEMEMPRSVDTLCMRGVSFVLLEVKAQNTYCCDTGDLDDCELKKLIASGSTVAGKTLTPAITGIDAVTTAGFYTIGLSDAGPWEFYTSNSSFHQGVGYDYGDGSGPGTNFNRIFSITVYKDITAANECRDGRVISYPGSVADIDRAISKYIAPLAVDPCSESCGLGWDPDTMVAVVREIKLDCVLPRAERGDKPKVYRTITKAEGHYNFLGIVNPIYRGNCLHSYQINYTNHHLSPLTKWATPVPLVKFSLSAVNKVAIPPTVTIDPTSIEDIWTSISG